MNRLKSLAAPIAESGSANATVRAGLRMAASALLLWSAAGLSRFLGSNRPIAAMVQLLAVLAIAARGDWILALFSSMVASLAFGFYFIEPLRTFRVTTLEGALTFVAMALTASIGSQLTIRVRRLAEEAVRRREEMERLNHLGKVLLASGTLTEAAENAVREVVNLFGLRRAVLRVEGIPESFQAGSFQAGAFQAGALRPGAAASDRISIVPLEAESGADVLELHGARLSDEVRNALASMIGLALERARTAEERAEIKAIRRGEELRSTVLNALAHNFKTPLTSIKAAASILCGPGSVLSADQRELAVVVEEETDRLHRLIRESLELAKLEGRRANPATEECRITGIVERVTARMARYFRDRRFIIEIPEDLPAIMGDSFLLEQMLLQVVDNAWKYSRRGTPIRISAALSERNIVLTVRNEGDEIPEEERGRIFDKFYRGARDRDTVEGTGLGLTIAKTIAETYQGKFWLDTEPEGPAFHFALPVEAAEVQTTEIQAKKRLHDREPHHITH